MAILLIAAALIAGLPLALALGPREQGQNVLQQVMGVLYALPSQVRDGTRRVLREARDRFWETLRQGGIRDHWLQQTVAALFFAPLAITAIWALLINLTSAQASAVGANPPILTILSSFSQDLNTQSLPVILTGLEMLLSAILFPALLLEMVGFTNFVYYLSEDNIPNKWVRHGFTVFVILGTIAAGYLVLQGGLLRGAMGEGTSTGTDLVQVSGLDSEAASSGTASSSGAADPKTGGSTNTSTDTALQALRTGPSLLAYLAGAIALFFMFPITALLVGTPLFLAVAIPAGILWIPAAGITWLLESVYRLMLALFNYTLRLRGAEPIEGPGASGAPSTQTDSDGGVNLDGQASSGGSPSSGGRSGPSRTDGPDPSPRANGRTEHGQVENDQSEDPAGDPTQTDPLYDEDDENWNPIA